MATNPFDDYFEQQRSEETAYRIQVAKPDETARAKTIAKERGIPSVVVQSDLPTFEAQQRATRANEMMRQYPAIGRWSADPANVTVAADDYDNLGIIGKAMYMPKAIGKSLVSGWFGLLGSGAGFVQELSEVGSTSPIARAENSVFGGSIEALLARGAKSVAGDLRAVADEWQPKSGNSIIDATLSGVHTKTL